MSGARGRSPAPSRLMGGLCRRCRPREGWVLGCCATGTPGGLGAPAPPHPLPHISSSDPQGVYLCVSEKKKKRISEKKKKKDFRKILHFFIPGATRRHPAAAATAGDAPGCGEAERLVALSLRSLPPALHAVLQPAPLQRRQLEPISAGAAWRGCWGKPWFAAACIPILRERLARRLPTFFPLINIRDNYGFVKKSLARHVTSIIAPR